MRWGEASVIFVAASLWPGVFAHSKARESECWFRAAVSIGWNQNWK